MQNLFDLTRSLISISSITGHEHKAVAFLKKYLENKDFNVTLQEVVDGRCNVFARQEDPKIVLTTHIDTVAPFVPFSEDNDLICGRGACDAKGIMASQITAACELVQNGTKDVGLLFVIGEESGSNGARSANTLENTSQFLILGEPTDNKMAKGSKGAIRMRIHTQGKSAHSAYPECGESAILKLMQCLNELSETVFPEDSVLGKTTINIGTIKGGTQANVVPDAAEAEILIRTVSSSEELKRMIEVILKDRAEVFYEFVTDPIELNTLEEFETMVVAFATDIPLLSNWGEPFLMGPGSILNAHTDHERILKNDLIAAVALYKKAALQLRQKL